MFCIKKNYTFVATLIINIRDINWRSRSEMGGFCFIYIYFIKPLFVLIFFILLHIINN